MNTYNETYLILKNDFQKERYEYIGEYIGTNIQNDFAQWTHNQYTQWMRTMNTHNEYVQWMHRMNKHNDIPPNTK